MDLTALRRKYAALVVLRARREELEAVGRSGFGADEERARRDTFRGLAMEFPGALRELDATPAARLAARLAEIDDAIACGGAAPAWMVIVGDFHRTLRELLALKKWLAAGGDAAGVDAWHAAWPHAHGLLCPGGGDVIDAVRHPPEGRLMTLVWRALGDAHGHTPEAIATLVLGAR